MKRFAAIAADGKTIVATGYGEHEDTVKNQTPPPGGSVVEIPLTGPDVRFDNHTYDKASNSFVALPQTSALLQAPLTPRPTADPV